MVYGLAFGKDGEIYLTQQQGGSNEDLGGSSDNLESKSTCSGQSSPK